MADLLEIPAFRFDDAAEQVEVERTRSGVSKDINGTEAILESYFNLGTTHTVEDFHSGLAEIEKTQVVGSVARDASQSYGRTLVTLEIVENLNDGRIYPPIAEPNLWQDKFAASKSTETPAPGILQGALDNVSTAVTDIGAAVKSALESFLKGLGLDVPLWVVIVVVLAFFAFVFYKSMVK